MIIEGVDYAFTPHPAPSGLASAGKKFAVRYGGPGGNDKHLHAAEASALAAAGLWIVANAEGTTGGFAGTSAGKSYASSADSGFRALDMPSDRPIYFSVDYAVTAAQWPAVAAALRGAASVIGASRVGVYGSLNCVRWARRDGVAAWFWQTYAWSGGQWADGNHLEQYHNGVSVAGGDCDLNRALTADYGQWQPGKLPTGGDDMSTVDSLRLKLLYENWAPTKAEWVAAGGVAAVYDTLAADGSGTNGLTAALAALNAKVAAVGTPDPTAVAAALAGNTAFVGAIAAALAGLVPTVEELRATVDAAVKARLDGATVHTAGT